jgi:hypothetical protein
MSGIIEFGFEESKVVKPQGIDSFKLSRSGEVARISIIIFKLYHEVIWAQKAKEAGRALTEEEKQMYLTKVNSKLAEKLGKKPEELTEFDRLDINSPKFGTAFTHYRDGIGSIRCLSKYEGGNLVKPEICCNDIGEAEQQVATLVLKYPVEKDGKIDLDLLKQRKYTEIMTWRMSAKRFKKIESTYTDARNNKMPVIDLKLTLDGDPKYKKLVPENGYTAAWAREDADPELRRWVLESGLRNVKYLKSELGFEMSKEKLTERLRGASESAAALSGGEASAASPQITTSYDALLE